MRVNKTITLPLNLELQEKDGELQVVDAYLPVMVEGEYVSINVGDLQKNCRGNLQRWLTEDFQELLRKESKA